MAKRNLLSLMVTASFLVFLGACTTNSEPQATSSSTSIASLEFFPPENVRQIFKRSCEACHGYDGHGIYGVAPDMLRHSNRTASEWAKYFGSPPNAPPSLHPGAQTPSAIWMSRDEITAVATYLAQLNGQASAPVEAP